MAKIPNFKFRGIQRITVPKSDADFNVTDYGLSILKKYMPLVLQQHQLNRRKIDYLHNVALGEQDINGKKRLYNKDAKNNNIISENHAFRQTNFKVAFVTSEKRDYAHKSDSNCKDMIFLDRYFTDIDFYAKDKNIKEWIYQTGIGCSYQCHRTDIIKKDVKNKLEYLSGRISVKSIINNYNKHRLYIDSLLKQAENSVQKNISQNRINFSSLISKLDALSPLKIISRGYSVIKIDNEVVKSVNRVNVNDTVNILLNDGTLNAVVTDKEVK